METLVKKHFWVFNLVFLLAGAWLLSKQVNSVLAYKLREIPALSKGAAGKSKIAHRLDGPKDNGVIVDRNYFGSAMSLPVEAVEEGPALDEASAARLLGSEGTESALNASLVGTIVADPDSWSMAMITDKAASETGVYRQGDRLMEEADVLRILSDRVILNHNGVREYLLLQEKAQPKNPKVASARPPGPPSGDSTLGEGIKKVNDSTYSIERGEIDKTLSNLNSIAMQARIVPSFKNGEANGFKLFAIRPGSLYSKIGIQNGDIIHKINGFAMNSPDKALEVYQKLKNARSIEVELTRRGQTQKMTYNIE